MNLVDTSRPTVSHGRMISTGRALTTVVWYPDRDQRWPLIVFAAGYEVGPAPYSSLLEAWAAHGYVVAAPEFPLTDIEVAGANLDESDIDNQPEDVRYVTESLVSSDSPIADRIDPTRVAVAGHSDGAETVLAVGTEPTPAGEAAYRAVIAFGVQPVPQAADRNPPILVGQGDQDQINPPSNGYATYDEAARPKYLLIMKGAGHLPPLEAGSQWLPGVETVTEAFLDAYLAGDVAVTAVTGAPRPYPRLVLETGRVDAATGG